MLASIIAGLALCLPTYPWPTSQTSRPLVERIAEPPGYKRVTAPSGSFAEWLRSLPLRPGRPDVRLYSGERKANQAAHYAVVDIDVGRRDLQQCADAVIRLRAEYLFSAGKPAQIGFHYTNGTWKKYGGGKDHDALRTYLDDIFMFAGTRSLQKELEAVAKPNDIAIGDVFIRGGSPGHAVIVVDVAEDEAHGSRVFLLAQSYMPAQDIHVIVNPNDADLSPWYRSDFGETLNTAEWVFKANELRRWPQ